MSIFNSNYSRETRLSRQPIVPTPFNYVPRPVADMFNLTSTQRAISAMREVIIAWNDNSDAERVEEVARLEAEKLSIIIEELQHMASKVGTERVDRLLHDMFTNRYVIESIKHRHSLRELKDVVVDENEIGILNNGFKKHIGYVGQSAFIYYSKDPVELLNTQVSLVNRADFTCHPGEGSKLPNAVSAGLGQEVYPVVRDLIEMSSTEHVRWHEPYVDGEQSVVAFLQLYSDKSKTTMKMSGITFYPFHLNIMNFSEPMQSLMKNNGHTILAFLPVEFTNVNSLSGSVDAYIDQVSKLKTIHQVICDVMKPLSDAAVVGIPCTTKDKKILRLHLVLGSYIADIPEQKDMLGVRYSNRTMQPCPRCHVPVQDMKHSKIGDTRSVDETRNVLSEFEALLSASDGIRVNRPAASRALKDRAKKKLDDISVQPIIPVLSQFPFVGATPYLDIYGLFSVEPMHVFHLGVSRMIKDAATDRLRCNELRTDHYRTVDRRMRSFPSIRPAILRQVNAFVDEVSRKSDGTPIGLYIKNVDGRPGLNGMYTDEGLTGMLEAADIKKLDMISPFIGGIFDRVCGESETCPITTVFTEYVDVMNKVCGHNGRDVWSGSDISQLRRDIKEFKRNGVRVFGSYQKSGMGTVKWHLLEHVADDIVRNGGLQLCDAGMYEYSHIIFKQSYARTSKRRNSAMDESIAIVGRRVRDDSGSSSRKRAKHIELDEEEQELLSIPRKKACKEDTACASWAHITVTAVELEGTLNKAPSRILNQYPEDSSSVQISPEMWNYLRAIGIDAHRTLVQLVKEQLTSNDVCEGMKAFVQISFSRSVYVSGIDTPTGTHVTKDNEVLVAENDRRYLQRVFATDDFYNTGRPRFETIMVQAGYDTNGSVKMNKIWFAKALGFITIHHKPMVRPNSIVCMRHNKPDCGICTKEVDEQFVFVQYYDVIDGTGVPQDGVDEKLNCIRLKWDRHGSEEDGKEVGKVFALCPLDSIRGRVHIVRSNALVELLHDTVPYKKALEEHLQKLTNWQGEMFYVNRFYRSDDHMFKMNN